jgi:hypothetical protein
MSITLNGSTGITTPDTSATTLTASTSVTTPLVTNAGTLALSATGANVATISTNGSERVRVTSGGDVGIGTTSPGSRLEVKGTWATGKGLLGINADSGTRFSGVGLQNNGTFKGALYHDNTDLNVTLGTNVAEPLVFRTNDAERARITSGGYFKASNTGAYRNSTSLTHEFRNSTQSAGVLAVGATNASFDSSVLFVTADRNTTNNSFYAIDYYNDGAAAYKFRVADSGNVTNTNNSYLGISDEKIKQDIVDAASQWGDIKGLRVRKYRFKNDPTGPLQIGVIAQEVELVSPGLIDEHPDYEEVEVTDDEGNVTKERQPTGTVTKAVKYSILYMKAIKALQEAMDRIEQLEAKVAALEGTE